MLTSTPSTAPMEAASSVSIAALFTDHPGAHIIAVELWVQQAVDRRMFTASYPRGDLQVVIRRWVWATGQRHVHLTASAATHQFLATAQTFAYRASVLVLSGEISATQVDVDASPTLDAVATAAAGEPLDYCGVARLLRCWARGESTLFAFGIESPSTPQNDADAGTLAIELRPVGQTIDVIARFLGVGPRWTRATEPEQLSVASLHERLAATVVTAPPSAGSNDAFARFWNQEWTELRVRSLNRSFRVIATPSAGLLSIGAPQTGQSGDAESIVPLANLPSYAFCTQLLDLFESELRR